LVGERGKKQMWTEYVRSLYPKATIQFNDRELSACVNMDTEVITIPTRLAENVITRAVVKHELGHLLFTKKAYDVVAKEENVKVSKADFDMTNAIEDIRIEKRFGADYIGMKRDFEEMSEHIFSKIENIPLSLNGLGMLTSYYLNFGKYPSAKVDDRLMSFFEKVKSDLYTKFLGLTDVNGSLRLAKELLDKFEKEFGELPQRQEMKEGEGKEGEGKEGKEGEGKEGEGKEGEGKEGDSKEGKEGEGKEGGVKKVIAWGDDKIQKGISSVHDLIKEFVKDEINSHGFSGGYSQYVNCGETQIYDSNKLQRKFESLSARKDTAISGQILKIRQVLLGWLVDEARNRTMRLVKKGKLSSRDLFRVKTEKEPKVFKKKIMGESNTVDLEILIDHSGSMRGSTISIALDTALVFNEALKGIKQVNYEITGFTTDGFYTKSENTLDNVYYVYKEFGKKANALTTELLKKDMGSGFGKTYLFHNNDFEALNYAEKRLKVQNNNRKILFVVSDGRPEIGYVSSGTMNTLTRDKIRDLRKKGYEVYGFGIEVNLKDLYEDNFVAINDVKQLANIVSTKLLKVIQK
jgi:cobalamin biosynthesis protein CobT